MVVDRRLSLSLVRFGCRHVVSRLSVLFADCRDRLSMKILIVGAQLWLGCKGQVFRQGQVVANEREGQLSGPGQAVAWKGRDKSRPGQALAWEERDKCPGQYR